MCYSSQSTQLTALPAPFNSVGFFLSRLSAGGCRKRLAATFWLVGWLMLQLAPQARALNVLLIWDVNDSRTIALASAIQQAGHTVTLSATSETGYDGTNPSPSSFGVVIHLNGTTYLGDMPEAGQQALTNFVAHGGGYIGSEWNAFEWLQGRLQQMTELILLDSSSGQEGSVTVTNASRPVDPPLLAGLASSFTFQAGHNVGLAHAFEQNPVTVLARDTAGNDAVVVRHYGPGRVVAFHHAANYGSFNTLLDANVQRLYLNAVAWAGSGAPWITAQPQSLVRLAEGAASFSVTVSGAEPLSYQWLKNAVPLTNGGDLLGATSATLSLAKVGDGEVGSYSVVVSNAFGCARSLAATLTVNHLPLLTSQPDSVTTNAGCGVAFGVTATGTPPLRYQWIHNRTNRLRDDERTSGAATPTLTRRDVSDPDQGWYQVVVENDFGSSTSAVATLRVIHPPVLLSQPAEVRTNAGGNVTFSVTASGTLPLAYRWVKQDGQGLTDAANRSGSTTPTLTLSNVLGGDAGEYRVIVTNVAGSLTSSPAALVVVDPILTGQPASLVQNAGTTARFSVQAYGTAPSYSWYKNGAVLADQGPISGSASPTLCLSDISDADVADYFAVVRNAFGSVTSSVVSLAVINPPLVTRPPDSRTNVAGTTANFAVSVSGTAPFTYQWFKDTSPISGATEAALTLAGVSDADAGAYSVSVANAAGSVTSPAATLTIIHPPLILRQPVSQTNLAGTTVRFTAQASGTAPLGYQWRFGSNNLTDGGQFSGVTTPTLSVINLHPTNAGQYSLAVTNPAGSTTSLEATLAVSVLSLPPPTGLIGWWPGDGDARDIFGTNHGTLQGATADGTGMVGQAFSFNGIDDYVQIADAPALRPTNLTVEAWVRFDAAQSSGNTSDPYQQYLIFHQNTRLSGFEGFCLSKEHFYPEDHLVWEVSSAEGQNVSVISLSPIVVGVWYHVAAVRGPDFIQLYVNGKLEGTAPVDFAQNYGNRPLYLGSSGQSYYDRKFQGELDEVSLYGRPLAASEIAAIYAAGGRGKTKTGGTLSLLTQPLSQSVKPGATATLRLTPSGTGPIQYQWRFNGTNLTEGGQFSGTTTAALSVADFQAANAGAYSALVWNTAGALTSAAATLLLSPGRLFSLPQQDGECHFILVGNPGRSYVLETSADLVEWSALRTITLSGGPAEFSEPMTQTCRFFRVKLLP